MKRKYWILFLISILMICCMLGLVACNSGDGDGNDSEPEDNGNGLGYSWADNDHSAYSVSGIIDDSLTDIVVPSTYKGKPVISISALAFRSETIESVTISEGIKRIYDEAFGECINLKTVYLPNSIESIAKDAFRKCPSLEKNVYNGVSYIGNETNPYVVAMGPRDSLTETEYQLHDETRVIANYAFYDCREISTLVLPSELHTIGQGAFDSAYNLTSVTLPDSLRTISDNAFGYCNMPSLEIPANVTYIGNNVCSARAFLTVRGEGVLKAINNCVINTDEKSLVLGCSNSVIPTDGSVTEIGQYAFSGVRFSSITIPAQIKTIGRYAFYTCSNLTTVNLNEGLEIIDDSAFSWCKELSSITFPQSVVELGAYAFSACSSLTSVALPEKITEIQTCTFRGCKNLVDVTISGNVTTISNAFEDCGLENVVIPSSVISLDLCAFIGCRNLTTVTFENTQNWQRTNYFDETGTPVDVSNPEENVNLFLNNDFGVLRVVK